MRSLLALGFFFTVTTACQSQGRAGEDLPIGLFGYDRRAPLGFDSQLESQANGIETRSISYASPRGGRVTGLLFVPAGQGPFAAVILQHGMPSRARDMSNMARQFASRGAVVVAIDAPWARSGSVIHWDGRDSANQVQLIVDLQRAVDLLLTRSDVDSGRIAYVGVSYGGAMGGLFAGIERRLSAYVLRVGDGGLVSHFTGAEDPPTPPGVAEPAWTAWQTAMEPIEPIRFVGRANAPVYFQNGEQDRLVPPADARAYQAAGPASSKVSWYPAGHGLNEAANLDMLAWLKDRIGLTL